MKTIHDITDYTVRPPEDWAVMIHAGRAADFGGTAGQVFGRDFGRLEMGEPQRADDQRGAYEWWPLLLDGRIVGEVRDDANGITVHIEQ